MPGKVTKSPNSYEYVGKILVVGNLSVGKTSLMFRYCRNEFFYNQQMTLGVDFCVKNIPVDKKEVKVQIWDTAGQEKYRSIVTSYFQKAHGIVLTYAVNDRESFNSLGEWMEEVKQKAPKDVAIVLVGNKADIGDLPVESEPDKRPRKVSFSEGKGFADKYGIKFFEVSSKDNINVNEVFHEMAKEIKELLEEREREREKKDEEEFNRLRATTKLFPQKEKNGCFDAFVEGVKGLFRTKKVEEKVNVHVKKSVKETDARVGREARSRINCESIRRN